jgi:hypothetical protein
MPSAQLKLQLMSTLRDVNAQVDEIIKEAKKMGVKPVEIRHSDGTWALTGLLIAKAEILNGLAVLEAKRL